MVIEKLLFISVVLGNLMFLFGVFRDVNCCPPDRRLRDIANLTANIIAGCPPDRRLRDHAKLRDWQSRSCPPDRRLRESPSVWQNNSPCCPPDRRLRDLTL